MITPWSPPGNTLPPPRWKSYEKQEFIVEAKRLRHINCCSVPRTHTVRIGWAQKAERARRPERELSIGGPDCLWVCSRSQAGPFFSILTSNSPRPNSSGLPAAELLRSGQRARRSVRLPAHRDSGSITSHRRSQSSGVLGRDTGSFVLSGSICGPRSPTEEESGKGRAPGTTGKRNDNSGRAVWMSGKFRKKWEKSVR